jgi:hypothetical protein
VSFLVCGLAILISGSGVIVSFFAKTLVLKLFSEKGVTLLLVAGLTWLDSFLVQLVKHTAVPKASKISVNDFFMLKFIFVFLRGVND